jgi:hypothetical protein
MLRRLRNAKCDETPLFAQATEQLYELEPSSEAAYNMAAGSLEEMISKGQKTFTAGHGAGKRQGTTCKVYYEYACYFR